jgi:hypothetical protein
MTSNGDRATFTFQEIGHSGADGKKRATEIIIWIAGTLVLAAINLLEPNISFIISLESHALSFNIGACFNAIILSAIRNIY